MIAPSVKVTVPVGVPVAETTVAVKVTESPTNVVGDDATTVVVVGAGATVWPIEVPLGWVTLFPANEAPTEREPTASPAVEKVADPFDTDATPSVVGPSVKVTVPNGEPVALATVAVNVTLVPKIVEFELELKVVVLNAGLTTSDNGELVLPR